MKNIVTGVFFHPVFGRKPEKGERDVYFAQEHDKIILVGPLAYILTALEGNTLTVYTNGLAKCGIELKLDEGVDETPKWMGGL